MADRIPQYPMVPDFNAGLMQQQPQQHQLNQQQAQHQQQQDAHPNISGFPDNGRMWQQIQQMQFRPSGGEMNNTQVNSQMMDLIRSQSLAREQQHLGQQQFALQSMSNGGNGRPGGTPQQSQPGFHDPSSNQQGPPHMSPGFPAMSSGNLPGGPSVQSLNPRNAAMMAFQGNPGAQAPHLSRQLGLMALAAQNQQNQNAPANFAVRQQQQQQAQHQQLQAMNQSPPGELFSSQGISTDRGPSPAHTNIHPANPMGGQLQQATQQRRLTMAELTERASTLRAHIAAQEQQLQNFNAPSTAASANVMNKMTQDLKMKKEYLGRIIMTIQAQANMINQAAVQQQSGSSTQAPWMQQPAISGGYDNNNSTQMLRMQSQAQNSSQSQNNPQPSPAHHHAQLQGNHILSQPISSPRSGPTPQQLPHPGGAINGSQFSNQSSANMGQQFHLNGNNVKGTANPPSGPPAQTSPISLTLPPPLEKQRFDSAYKSFIQSKGIKHEMRLMNVEGRGIDLYALHTNVMQEGGANKVQNNDLWAVIGARMGFVHFPGTESEPAKAGPGVAQRLAQVYREYLGAFDVFYINSVLESRKKMQATAAIQQIQAHQAAQQQAAANGTLQGQQHMQPGQNRGVLSPQQMQQVIGYANQSVTELRAQGVPEKIIHFVESNRAHLQRTVMEQGMFRGQFQINQAHRPQDQHTPANGSGGFVNAPSHGSGAANDNQRQFQFTPQGMMPMQGSNSMDTRQPQQPHNPQMSNGLPQLGRLSKEQSSAAVAFIGSAKSEFQKSHIPLMRPQEVPNEQRPEFNSLLDQLHRYAQEMDSKLPMYYFVLNTEDLVRKLISIIVTVIHQRTLLNSPGGPRFIVNVEALRSMMQQVQKSNQMFTAQLHNMINRPQNPQHPQQHSQLNHAPLNGHQNHPPPEISRPPLPQVSQPSLLSNRPPVNLRQPPVKKQPTSTPNLPPQHSPSMAAVSTPTPPPAYSAHTPVANASTPTQIASSPQAPKSPKGVKVPAKAKAPPKRRMSVKNAPLPPPEQHPQTTASANATASGSGSNIKRPREEEPSIAATLGASPSSGSVANEPSPPKRIKTEWEGPPSEALKKKTEAVENVKTEEDASAFLEQMTELIKMAAGGEGQESLTSDISDTLDQILKGYGATPDVLDRGLTSHGLGESGAPNLSSPPTDEFIEFFDFSSFGTIDDDDDSKAPTPDLTSSSTGPSPDSGSEADAAHHALLASTDIKTEDMVDPLRLGNWKEIDGGESAYYQTNDWKWDSPMATQEQPWAIFTS